MKGSVLVNIVEVKTKVLQWLWSQNVRESTGCSLLHCKMLETASKEQLW